MSRHQTSDGRHRFWRRLYGALSVVLPAALREKHGPAMADLFVQELDRSADGGVMRRSWTAVRGLCDLLQRGVYERVIEERAAISKPDLQPFTRMGKAFLVAFSVLTSILLALYARRVPRWHDSAVSLGTVFEAMVYAVPFTVSLTLPMAVFVAVLATASNSTDSENHPSRRDPDASPRLRLAPLLLLTALLAMLAFAWNAEVVPRANAHLSTLQDGAQVAAPNDRSMTIRELRAASERAAQETGAMTNAERLQTIASYDIEIHKKSAIAAACVVFALLAAGISRRVPRAGIAVQGLASVVAFTIYYWIILTGETLADQTLISPAVAMWSANVLLLGVAVLALRGRRRGLTGRFASASETVGA